jgi:sugar lactone lactonase YvrE
MSTTIRWPSTQYSLSGAQSVFSTQTGTTDIGLAFNSSGTLYAATRDSNAILQYLPSGVESTFASVSDPYGVAVDVAGNVFTGANFGEEIMEYSPSGAGSVFATGTDVFSLAFNGSGDLFEGTQSGSIYEFAPNGTSTLIDSGLELAAGMAFDEAGNLYVADWLGQIIKIAPNGTTSVFATFSTATLPTGLVYDDSTGNLYMSEVANGESLPGQQAIFEFSPSGVESVFASGLYLPYGIADLQSTTPEPVSALLLGGGLALIALGRSRLRR